MRHPVSALIIALSVGAVVAVALAAALQAVFGVLYEAPTYKVYFPIAITGMTAAWLAAYRPGSQEDRLFRAVLLGTGVGAVAAFRFLLGEAYEGLFALKLGLGIGLCALLAAAASLSLPAPELFQPMEHGAKRKLRRQLGAFALASGICWFLPLPPWRIYWKPNIHAAAVRYLEERYNFDNYILTIDGASAAPTGFDDQPEPRDYPVSTGERIRFLDESGPARCELENMIWADAVTVHVQVSIYGTSACDQGLRLVLQLTPSGWSVIDDVCEWIT